MAVVVGFLIVGMVIAIAAFFVTREAKRIAHQPPPALYHLDDALAWVVEHVPDDVAATLTTDDVRRILEFQVEFFKRKGVSSNGSTAYPPGTVVIGGSETVDYILERCAATGEAYLPEQVYGVIDTQLSYLRAIGAVGPPRAATSMPAEPVTAVTARRRTPPVRALVRSVPMCRAVGRLGTGLVRGTSFAYQGKEVVHTMHDQHGTLEVRGR